MNSTPRRKVRRGGRFGRKIADLWRNSQSGRLRPRATLGAHSQDRIRAPCTRAVVRIATIGERVLPPLHAHRRSACLPGLRGRPPPDSRTAGLGSESIGRTDSVSARVRAGRRPHENPADQVPKKVPPTPNSPNFSRSSACASGTGACGTRSIVATTGTRFSGDSPSHRSRTSMPSSPIGNPSSALSSQPSRQSVAFQCGSDHGS